MSSVQITNLRLMLKFPQSRLCINASFQTNQENLFCKEFQGSVPVIFHTFINKNCGLVPKSRNLQIVVNTWYNFAHKQCNCLLGQQAAALSDLSVKHKENQTGERIIKQLSWLGVGLALSHPTYYQLCIYFIVSIPCCTVRRQGKK